MGEKLWTREFIGMGLTNFFYFMSQYIMIAALPVYIMDDLGLGEWEAGMAMTCFQIATVVSRPLAGRVIDAVNKQRLLLIVSVLLFFLMAGFLLAYRLEIALSLRLIHGIVFALGTTASAAMAALVLPGRRKGEGIGYFAVCGNMAMVVGPLVGLILIEHFGASVLFLFLSLMAACAIVSGNGKRLPARVVCPSGEKHHGFHFSDFFEKKALPAVILGGLVFFAYGGVLIFIPMYTRSLGIGSYTSLFFLVFALVIVVYLVRLSATSSITMARTIRCIRASFSSRRAFSFSRRSRGLSSCSSLRRCWGSASARWRLPSRPSRSAAPLLPARASRRRPISGRWISVWALRRPSSGFLRRLSAILSCMAGSASPLRLPERCIISYGEGENK